MKSHIGEPIDVISQAVLRRAESASAVHRLPGLAAGAGLGGKLFQVHGLGDADVASGRGVRDDTQFRIGSVTKTFTAALVLRLAEGGLLDLDASVQDYLPGTGVGTPRLRQLLAHCGGVQREAPVAMWSTMQGPGDAEFLACLPQARMVARPGARWHYSNLGYAILGQIVRSVIGVSCEELISEQLLGPLGLNATTWQPLTDAACGYRLDPYNGTVHTEPVMQQGAIGVGGQLWSTVPDLLTWGHTLLGGTPEVLPATVTDAMHTLQVMVDPREWTQGWGLGLILDRRHGRILSGHTGAMPGFLAALSMDRETGTVVAALANVTRGIALGGFVADLLADILSMAITGPVLEGGAPGRAVPCPPDLDAVLGRWWCEAEETVFTWRDGALHACLAQAPESTVTTFAPAAGADAYVAVQGRLQGELLTVVRDEHGDVATLEWATYPYARVPR